MNMIEVAEDEELSEPEFGISNLFKFPGLIKKKKHACLGHAHFRF